MQPSRFKLGPHLLRLVLPLALVLLAVGLTLTTRRLDAYNRSPYPLAPTLAFDQRIALPTEATSLLDHARIPVEFTLLRGETVAQVFQKLGLESAEARRATETLAEHLNLRQIKAGNRYSAFFNPDRTLASFELTLKGSGRFEMTRTGEAWQADWQPFQRSVEVRSVRGTVDGAFETSIRRAGGPSGLAYRMADVLQWDVDFARDLQRGDHFEVLYEEIQLDGQFHGIGNLLALVYEGKERSHQAYRYGEDGVYYDAEGRPLKKRFLRSPLRYSRVTSHFTARRFHPVLKIYRPHYGVDYGAPVGTPVQVTANGVVTFAGWDRGGGNVVKVRHGDDYETAYLHLSKFASGIRRGARVRQGDIIAFSGATGLASGPHLDYRVKHRDRWIDPLSLKGVRDETIPQHMMASYRNWRDGLRLGMRNGTLPEPGLMPAGETRLAVGSARPDARPETSLPVSAGR
ncbi:MAG TPA: peptidoglycan DD-metalloendopeptidase family protein [Thermoanaerobaculia bacterium]|nr:peptidoglycan DD-metalloendopeptidase family protein [Thermoanaerobaculia bacterium]